MINETDTDKKYEQTTQKTPSQKCKEGKVPPHSFQEIYTKSEVLHLFQKLNNRIEDLEHTVSILKKKSKGVRDHIPTKKDILGQLNSYDNGAIPAVDFNDMLKMIQTEVTVSCSILEDKTLKLYDLILEMFEQLCTHLDEKYKSNDNANIVIPMISFQDYHKNTMFVYSTKKQWSVIAHEDFQKLVQSIHIALIKQCNQWREKFMEQTTKTSSQSKELLSNKYTSMIARICNTSPHINQSIMQKLRKVWIETISETNIFRKIN